MLLPIETVTLRRSNDPARGAAADLEMANIFDCGFGWGVVLERERETKLIKPMPSRLEVKHLLGADIVVEWLIAMCDCCTIRSKYVRLEQQDCLLLIMVVGGDERGTESERSAPFHLTFTVNQNGRCSRSFGLPFYTTSDSWKFCRSLSHVSCACAHIAPIYYY
jgi:hypothetical protein